MRWGISMKYAVRSLARHMRRTFLSALGIGLGVGVCLFMVSFVRGEGEMIMRAASESGTGHMRIVPKEWPAVRENDMRLGDWKSIRESLQQLEGLDIVTPRARTEALLAFGTRVTGVEMVGVDPETEPETNRLVRNVTKGRYLKPGDREATVVGAAVADRLDVEVGDPLMVTVAGSDGEMRSAMLDIVGLVSVGSRDLEATICQVNLPDVDKLTGLEGAGELTMTAREPEEIPELKAQIAVMLPEQAVVMTWDEIRPELAAGLEVDKTWTRLMVGLVVVTVFLGIASAQLAAVLERRREFAVLSALGMKHGPLVRIMFTEGIFLGLVGGALGLAFGVPAAYYIAVWGIDFTAIYGQSEVAFSNILIDPILYGDFGWWLVPLAIGLSLTATVLSSLYPAWFAARTDPASALRVDQ